MLFVFEVMRFSPQSKFNPICFQTSKMLPSVKLRPLWDKFSIDWVLFRQEGIFSFSTHFKCSYLYTNVHCIAFIDYGDKLFEISLRWHEYLIPDWSCRIQARIKNSKFNRNESAMLPDSFPDYKLNNTHLEITAIAYLRIMCPSFQKTQWWHTAHLSAFFYISGIVIKDKGYWFTETSDWKETIRLQQLKTINVQWVVCNYRFKTSCH